MAEQTLEQRIESFQSGHNALHRLYYSQKEQIEALERELAPLREFISKWMPLDVSNGNLILAISQQARQIAELENQLATRVTLDEVNACEADMQRRLQSLSEIQGERDRLKIDLAQRDAAQARALQLWREAHPDTTLEPGHADLCLHLLAQVARQRKLLLQTLKEGCPHRRTLEAIENELDVTFAQLQAQQTAGAA